MAWRVWIFVILYVEYLGLLKCGILGEDHLRGFIDGWVSRQLVQMSIFFFGIVEPF